MRTGLQGTSCATGRLHGPFLAHSSTHIFPDDQDATSCLAYRRVSLLVMDMFHMFILAACPGGRVTVRVYSLTIF